MIYIQNVSSLPLDEQDFIVQTVSKRKHEIRRNQIAERAKETEQNYNAGNVTSGTVNDLMEELENGWNHLGWSIFKDTQQVEEKTSWFNSQFQG